jgi:hypothetical protein
MERKFRTCVDHLLTAIDKNNELNSRLTAEVGKLTSEVKESKQDILIIDEFIRINMRR